MLPTTVKVGGVQYTVEEQENLINIEDSWRRIDYFNSHIRIDKSLSADRKEQVLVHEMLHAIFLEAGYKEQEEDMINRVSIVLHQVLRDNPNLLNPLADVTQVALKLSPEEIEQLRNAPLTYEGNV